MKICFYTTGDIKYLATMKRALGMAQPLNQLGWSVFIIAEDSEENKKRVKLESPNSTPYFFKKTNAIKEVSIKNQLLKDIKPDVIWICSLGVRNFIKPTNKYKIFVEHSELGSEIQDNSFFKRKLIFVFEKISTKYSGLICASKYLERHFKKLNSKTLIHYSPYAYNSEVINSQPRIFDQLKIDYKGKKVFLYIGSLRKNYGLFKMLKAADLLRRDFDDFVLLLLGRGSDKEKAKLYIKENSLESNVVIPGYIEEEDLSSYFKLADFFISPLNDTIQDWARCPSKIYMYIPYKKPILTSEIGEPKVIFGDHGYYFDTSSPKSLKDLMSNLLKNSEIINNIDIENHSWSKRAMDFDEWFKSVF